MCGGGLLLGMQTPETREWKDWTTNLVLDNRSGKYPHVILAACHDCKLEYSKTVLLGELGGGVVTAIRNRMGQQEYKGHSVFPLSFMVLNFCEIC